MNSKKQEQEKNKSTNCCEPTRNTPNTNQSSCCDTLSADKSSISKSSCC